MKKLEHAELIDIRMVKHDQLKKTAYGAVAESDQVRDAVECEELVQALEEAREGDPRVECLKSSGEGGPKGYGDYEAGGKELSEEQQCQGKAKGGMGKGNEFVKLDYFHTLLYRRS